MCDRVATQWTPLEAGMMMRAAPIVGAVMDIVVWLRSLGLGKYEAAFRENDRRMMRKGREKQNCDRSISKKFRETLRRQSGVARWHKSWLP